MSQTSRILLLILLFAPPSFAEHPSLKQKFELFHAFWGSHLADRCSELKLHEIPKLNPESTKEARSLHTRIKFDGGVVSWNEGNVWNILMLEDVAQHVLLTDDALDFMLCHELGHFHVKSDSADNSEEFLADQYALRECLPKYWNESSEKKLKVRMEKALQSSMDYHKDFLETLAIGAGDGDRAILSCRRSAGISVVRKQAAPKCIQRLYGKSFYKRYRGK